MRNIVFLLSLVFISEYGQAQPDPPTENARTKKFSSRQLKEDFSLLRKALEEAHPALYKFNSKKTIDSLFDATEHSIKEGMTEAQFWALLEKTVGLIKCGHTRISPSDNYRKYFMATAHLLPFSAKIIDDRLYIFKNLSSDSNLVPGTEVLTINEVPVSRIIHDLLERTSADGHNTTLRYKIIEESFHTWYNLLYDETDTFSLKVATAKGTEEKVLKILSATSAERKAVLKKNQKTSANKNPLQFRTLDPQTALLTIKTFNSDFFKNNNLSYTSFIDSVFTEINVKKINRLAIDIRDNFGGDPTLVGYLYAKIALKEFSLLNQAIFKTDRLLPYFDKDSTDFYKFSINASGQYTWNDQKNDWYGKYAPVSNNFKGQAFLLVNGASFSSSGFFSTLFRFYKRGKIIGEETGGSVRCNDCHDNLILPNSQLIAEIPRCTFIMNLQGFAYDGHGIFPDIPVKYSVNDIKNEKDPVLDLILKQK